MSAGKHERRERGQGSATGEDEASKKPKRAIKVLVAVRLDPNEIERIDALISYFSTSWRKATRSDALRALLIDGLSSTEERAKRADAAKGKEAASKR